MVRWIVHVDMDCFFVSVERLKDSSLIGCPVAVGGRGRRGVIASASYEARQFGVRSAMPTAQALQLCPELRVVGTGFADYTRYSRMIFESLRKLAPVCAQVSVDEAYLDLTGCEKLYPSREESGLLIKKAIYETSGLVATVGIATNKLLAKIASDHAKPNGLLEIPAGYEAPFLAPLSVRKIPGVGPKTAYHLERLGFETCGDIVVARPEVLRAHWGPYGIHLQKMAAGVDDSPVREERERKSIGSEETFHHDVSDLNRLLVLGREMAEDVANQLRTKGLSARTVQVKMRYPNFQTITRALTLSESTCWSPDLIPAVQELIRTHKDPARPLRLLGVSVRNLEDAHSAAEQFSLFADPTARIRVKKLEHLKDELLRRFGRQVIVPTRRKG